MLRLRAHFGVQPDRVIESYGCHAAKITHQLDVYLR